MTVSAAWNRGDSGDEENGIVRVWGSDDGTNLDCSVDGTHMRLDFIDKRDFSQFRPGQLLGVIAKLFDVEITVTEKKKYEYK